MASNVGGYDEEMLAFLNARLEDADDAGKPTEWIMSVIDGVYDGDQTYIDIAAKWMVRFDAEAHSHF